MLIKKENAGYFAGVLLVAFFIVTFFIVTFRASTLTLQIKTPEQEIDRLIVNSTEVTKDNYKRTIKKIENMRFYNDSPIPRSREMNLHIVITDKNGKSEVVACNDNMVTHMYDGEFIAQYEIPFITQIGISFWRNQTE